MESDNKKQSFLVFVKALPNVDLPKEFEGKTAKEILHMYWDEKYGSPPEKPKVKKK